MKIPPLAILIGFLIPQLANSSPPGWRIPTAEELDGQPRRADSSNSYTQVSADFDGNGTVDLAHLFKSTSVSGEGLLVNLSPPDDDNWLILAEIDWGSGYPSVDLAMGIEVVPPGEYRTACGKGYWDCAPGEVSKLNLVNPGILYFRFESASSIFYWNNESGEFQQIWISD